MKATIIMFCLIGAVFANPISYKGVSESNELDSNSTEGPSVSQSSENDTPELQSSEENVSTESQSSKSESSEATSEDKTSEESDIQSDEMDSIAETSDNSMGSEENIRQNRVFSSIINVLSAEDNSSSTEVKGQSDELTKKQPTDASAANTDTKLKLVENPTDGSDTTSNSADTSKITGAVPGDSSESTSSESNETNETNETSESNETNETNETTDSSESNETNEISDSSESKENNSDVSQSAEDSTASDSTELEQIKPQDCVNGTQSCESEEYLFQSIGDDAHYSVDNLMAPDEDERELSLRR